jgi:hypothetical protein
MLFCDLGVFILSSSILWCDNVSVITVASNSFFDAYLMLTPSIIKLIIISFEKK